VKLTKPQFNMLIEAVSLLDESNEREQWFIPCKSGEAPIVWGTKATAKALCGKGLLEYHVAFEAVNHLPAIIEYRATEAGRWLVSTGE
jgi:hypothetical protein